MHAVALHAIRTACKPATRNACRFIGGSRHSLPRRDFHRSALLYGTPKNLPAAEEGKEDISQDEPLSVAEEARNDGEEADNLFQSEDIEQISQTLTQRQKGKALRRRSRQPEGLPPVVLPDWFWKNNVKCVGDPDLSGSLAVFQEGGINSGAGEKSTVVEDEIAQQSQNISDCDLSPTNSARYSIHVDIYKEILVTLKAALTLRPPKRASIGTLSRPITHLQCPKDGGTYYLDSVVETVASKLNADLIRIDAQDIAQILGPYMDENLAWGAAKTSLWSYDAQEIAGNMEEYDKETDLDEEPDAPEDEEPSSPSFSNLFNFGKRTPGSRDRINSFRINGGLGSMGLGPVIKGLRSNLPSGSTNILSSEISGLLSDPSRFSSSVHDSRPSSFSSDQPWSDLKANAVLDAIINATRTKRAKITQDDAEGELTTEAPRDIIIQIKDYRELEQLNAEFLWRLRNRINKQWIDGQNIICIGTTSTEEDPPALSRPEIQILQADIKEGEKRTIYVPPDRREEQEVTFESDEKARIRRMNVRHIEDMISKLVEGTETLSHPIDIEKDVDSAATYSADLEDAVWPFAKVHRVATTILGLESSATKIDGSVFSEALNILSASDEAKFSWGAVELKQEDSDMDVVLEDVGLAGQKQAKDKIKEIRKKATPHEKKLLAGVILPENLRTTFADIRAPKETVEALKTLTSLSLVRPEAFSYGVLATDKIPGLLLYGPPGTGKTLLAKAVAKESGVTMLEVSAADMNDMYVGEGEKNVKALFTLAKKLSPCVVFIDEADALFSARGDAGSRRTTHREMINQFLREWDGMNDFSAFIMVATNRPFDLDEAVLRRLPRRLLIDLPVEKDREAILKIHLKDEVLADNVSLSKLAKDTPFYSGSDLKNLSVAAALACIRDENKSAAEHAGEDAYVFPERRTLTDKHFERALEEISASISEDMSTLAAIRKFDEKYGDRKGRRKKGPGMGFGGTRIEEKDSEAARVRKLDV